MPSKMSTIAKKMLVLIIIRVWISGSSHPRQIMMQQVYRVDRGRGYLICPTEHSLQEISQ